MFQFDIKLIILDYTGLKPLYYHETIHVTIFADSYHKWISVTELVYCSNRLWPSCVLIQNVCMYTNYMPQFAAYPINKDLTTVIHIK
jgi:hypothetical protein